MKTHEVKAALKGHYKTSEYALLWEVGNSTGSNVSRHADAIVVGLWPSRGLYIEGIEIKVSRSDWRRELDNPAKAEPVAKFCDFWWIVAPEGIVQEHELPPLWGLKVVNEKGSIRTVKQAPKKDCVPTDRGFLAAMLRRASEADAATIDALVARKLEYERANIQENINKEVERRTRTFEAVKKNAEKLKAHGLDLTYDYAVDGFIENLKVAQKLRNMHGLQTLEFTAKNLAKIAETLIGIGEHFSYEDDVKKSLTNPAG